MRKLWVGSVVLLWFALFTVNMAFGLENAKLLEGLDISALEEAVEGVVEEGFSLDISLKDGVMSAVEAAADTVGEVVKSTLRTGVLLLLTVLLCTAVDSLQLPMGEGGVKLSELAGTAAVLALTLGDVNSLSALGQETMERMDQFSKVLLPTLTATAAASGAVTGAGVRQMVTMLCSDVLLTLIHRLLLPMVYLYTALCAGAAAVGNDGLKKLAGLLKWGITGALTGVLFLYVSGLSAETALAGSADALTAKTAGFAISSMVPVVGGILSSAAETVVAGAAMVKNAVGIFGLLGVLGFCMIPFLRMGVHYLIYKLTAALSASLSVGRLGGLIGDLAAAFGLILGMTGACGLVLMVSIISAVGVMTG